MSAGSAAQVQAEGGSGRRTMLLTLAVVAAALVLWGGYGHHWPWTGINGQTATLWDWLHLLLLPLAVGVLPIWLRRDARLQRRVKMAAFAFLAVLAALVLAGYLIPWNWTGFRGNSLWDWLNLVALPLAVAIAPVLPELREDWGPRHATLALVGATAFVVVAFAGYLIPWTWTGFTGNTLWDWLHLLLLPLLVPVLLVPAVKPAAAAPMVPVESEDESESESEIEGEAKADAGGPPPPGG